MPDPTPLDEQAAVFRLARELLALHDDGDVGEPGPAGRPTIGVAGLAEVEAALALARAIRGVLDPSAGDDGPALRAWWAACPTLRPAA